MEEAASVRVGCKESLESWDCLSRFWRKSINLPFESYAEMKLFCYNGGEEIKKNAIFLGGLKSIANTSPHWRNCAHAFVLAHVGSVIKKMAPSMLQHTYHLKFPLLITYSLVPIKR